MTHPKAPTVDWPEDHEPGFPMLDQLSSIASGAVGTYLVAAELVRRGYIVSVLSQTAKGIDILAADPQTLRPLAIQVKAHQGKGRGWVMTKDHEDIQTPGLFYVFVSLPRGGTPPEFFVVPSAVVADTIAAYHLHWLKTPGRKGQPHQDTVMRTFRDPEGRWLNRWDVLKVDQR